MQPTLFVSDVHLSARRPAIVERFEAFLAGPATAAEHLYLLGDCFDLYLGDDDATPPHPQIIESLKRLTAAGTPVSVLHGNHDFLLGSAFTAATGCELLPDHTVIEVQGERVLVMHGDTLCTDDHEYQAFRAYTRDPATQAQFLAKSLPERLAEAQHIKVQSQQASELKPDDIMDVNPEAVAAAMSEHDVRVLIHGHTHRPAIHELEARGERARRVVLGDWYQQDSVGIWDDNGVRLERVADLE